MGADFLSFRTAAQKESDEHATVVATVTQLLEEHAASREAATLTANLANTNMSETTRIEVPLSMEDTQRLEQLVTMASHPKHGKTVLGLMRQYMPLAFGDEPKAN